MNRAWRSLLPIIIWMIGGAAAARRTLQHAADELQGAAHEANHVVYGAGDVFARQVLAVARDRVAALRTQEPRPANAAAARAPPVAALRPGYGVLVNVKRGIDLLLAFRPSADVIRSSLRREPRPGWLHDVQMTVEHAVHGLSRARSELDAVLSDVAGFLNVPTPPQTQGASHACAAAAQHARRGAANLRALVDILRELADELEDEPPTTRVRHFFGYVYVPPAPPPNPINGEGAGAGAQD